MISTCYSVAFVGLEIIKISIQTCIGSGFSTFSIVGLPDKTVKESYERIRAAFQSSGLTFPFEHITINLSPASIHKEGTHYDLPIAFSILGAMGAVPKQALLNYIMVGELGLDGKIIGIPGIYAISSYAKEKMLHLICPQDNALEAVAPNNRNIVATGHLISAVEHLQGRSPAPLLPFYESPLNHNPNLDMEEVRGQLSAKRALEIAAAGGHNLLMKGPPGAGKSMLSSRLPTILPPLNEKEILEVNKISSIAGNSNINKLINTSPYRSPHHSCSMAAMVGGGKHAKPGEVTLAHKGVLFLDELPEFPKQVLDALRQPIESGIITVSRAHAHITYPAQFQLLAAMNPCHCGYLNDSERCCYRAPVCGQRYQAKLSGPILDRFDIHIEVQEIPLQDIHSLPKGEKSALIRERVIKARSLQEERYKEYDFSLNCAAPINILEPLLKLEEESISFINQSIQTWKLSMRGYTRILRVARTIADLDNSDEVARHHLAEAFSYRPQLLSVNTKI